jgi:hypothetical protein
MKKDHALVLQFAYRNGLKTRERMAFRHRHAQRFPAHGFQRQGGFLNREVQKSHVNAAFAQGLDLNPGRHVLQFDTHCGIAPGNEFQRLDENLTNASRHTYRQMADFAFAGLRGDLSEVIDLSEHLLGLVDDPLSGFRQPHFTLRSLKKPDSEFFLELTDLLAQRGLTDV